MIQPGTNIKISDNTNVREIRCIGVVGKRGRNPGTLGAVIVGSVKKLSSNKDSRKNSGAQRSRKDNLVYKTGDLVKALIVRTKKDKDRSLRTQTGFLVSFPHENVGILLGNNGLDPVGSRIKGPLSTVIKSKGYNKVLSLTKTVI